MKFRLIALLVSALVPALCAEEPEIIAKARSYLGTEDALNSVRTIHLVGTVTKTVSGSPKTDVTAKVDIFFEEPFRESVVLLAEDRISHTALDNFEAWQQIQTPRAPGQTAIDPSHASQLTLLGSDQTWALRADTLENLGFYRGVLRTGGAIKDLGQEMVDGISCEKVFFTYSPSINYVRYFDLRTGRLVMSETLGGAHIRESGEILAGGVRFPKMIATVETDPASKGSTTTYTFEKVAINERVPDGLFTVPMLQPVPQIPGTAAPAPTK